MKILKISDYIRWGLSLALLFSVYRETGIATVILCLLFLIHHELQYIKGRIENELERPKREFFNKFTRT